MSDIRILVVEDEAIVAKDLQNRLKKMGYDVPALAHTGRDAVRLADEINPDLILMDIRLRGAMDGIMAAEAIADKADIPVIFLTAYSDDQTVQRAKVVSPMGYLVKPFDDRDLSISIEMAFFRHYSSQLIAVSERKHRSIFENATDLIVHIDSEGVILDINHKSREMLGHSREEMIGRKVGDLEFIPDKIMAQILRHLKEAFSGRAKGSLSLELPHRHGKSTFLEANYSLFDSQEGGQDLLAVIRDVTHRVVMEKELQERNKQLDIQNEQLRTREEELKQNYDELAAARVYSDGLIKSLTDGFAVVDLDGTVIDVNDTFLQIVGLTREETIGMRALYSVFSPENIEVMSQMIETIFTGRTNIDSQDIEFPYERPDGTLLYLSFTHNIVRDASGDPSRVFVMVRDVTERRQAEEALRASEERFRQLFENINSIAIIYEAVGGGDDFIIRAVNSQMEQKLNIKKDDLIGRKLSEDFASAVQSELSDVLTRVYRTGNPQFYSTFFHRRDDNPEYMEVYVYKLPDGHLVSLFDDVTERRLAEEALRASEERFREMAELLPICLAEIDLEGKVIFANKHAETLYGYDWRSIEGGLNILDTVAPECRSRVIRNTQKVFEGERLAGNEYIGLKKDGNTFPNMVYSAPIERDGTITGLRIVAVDLTDRKRAEEESSRANALEELNRLKTILLATVSHELRTPLTSIKGLASTLIQPDVVWDARTQKEFLQEIDKAADRLTHIVGDLIDMSQIEAGMMRLEKSPTTISILLEQLNRQLKGITKKHRFKMSIPPKMPIIYCDEVRIGQVITNLVSNAAAYSPAGTNIELEAKWHGKSVEVSVKDEGIGIPENKQDSIFDRFHRLEEGVVLRRGGTGLGLAISKGIIENHGGSITVRSREGEGSCFSIFLPLPEAKEIFAVEKDMSEARRTSKSVSPGLRKT